GNPGSEWFPQNNNPGITAGVVVFGFREGAPLPGKPGARDDQRPALRVEEALKPTDLEAAIFMDSPVFGLRPWRAARFFTSKVPKPMIWTFLSFLTPFSMEPRTAARASSAARLVASLPRAFWM